MGPPASPRGFPLKDRAVLTPRVLCPGKGMVNPSPNPPCLFSASPRMFGSDPRRHLARYLSPERTVPAALAPVEKNNLFFLFVAYSV